MRLPAMLLGVLVLISAPAEGQEYVPADSHEHAVVELIELLRLEELSAQSAEIMMESMIAQNPVLARFRDIFEEFFATYVRWEDLLPEYVRIYREAYTEPELRELLAFYDTPVGRKTVRLTPRLMRQGAAIGQAQIEPHLPELERRIQERLRGGVQP